MSLKALYPLTGTIMIMGLAASLYGVQSGSFPVFIEGVFLMWLSFSLTINIWETQRLPST
jgi:hypothetical protein